MATKIRSVRVPDEIWDTCVLRAEAAGTTISAKILFALRAYAFPDGKRWTSDSGS